MNNLLQIIERNKEFNLCISLGELKRYLLWRNEYYDIDVILAKFNKYRIDYELNGNEICINS